MDWLTFISSMVGSLAWPVLLLFIFCTLWHYFPRLAPFVHQLKYGGVEITFRQEATAVAAASVVLLGDHAAPARDIPNAAPTPEAEAALEFDPPISAESNAPPIKEEAQTKMRMNVTEEDARAYLFRSRLEAEAVSGDFPMSGLRLLSLANSSPRDAVLEAWQWIETTLFQVLGKTSDGAEHAKYTVLNIIAGLYMNIFTQPQVTILTSLYNMKKTAELDPKIQVSPGDAFNYLQGALNLRRSLREHTQKRTGRQLPFDD